MIIFLLSGNFSPLGSGSASGSVWRKLIQIQEVNSQKCTKKVRKKFKLKFNIHFIKSNNVKTIKQIVCFFSSTYSQPGPSFIHRANCRPLDHSVARPRAEI